jgi:hypothetical protein
MVRVPDVINPWWFAPAGLLIFGGLAWAGIAHLIRRCHARRLIARFRDVGAEMAEEGYFDTDRDRRLLEAVFDAQEVPPWERS